MSLFFSYSMFFLSFAPLWISVAFIDIRNIVVSDKCLYTEWISIAAILLASIISLGVILFALNTRNTTGAQPYTIRSVKEKKIITAEYLLSYILPLFAFDFTRWDSVVLFLVFYVTLGFICIRHSYFGANIVLETAHYSFYECSLENEDGILVERTIVSNRKLNGRSTERVVLRALNNDYSLDVSDAE